ncbi:surface antigen BspA-like [Trichomonas vaginalis G3]|uniref:Surface antigen BspA-like n=1 Tax=Trichomonas vaginalis (strain ATCC PRA-98 / G3) TaxID=412133 RepID=A2D7A2_TRIV3|nr:antigen BSP-related family [Trichomonas vaginalis G3]EAY23619.1 surface antigen BspA-like [Trichomonas vaginalis G3]KAI5490111.1 antigen BSP-related family [Trichomonas vaginalis G3]|eukprot:XP_001276867.1 surface antigen BspA-like [Trichomonas vaginalis G3]
MSQCTKLLLLSSAVFSRCYYLESIKMPPKITKINNGCFYFTKALKKVILPDSVTEFGRVFGGSGLEELIISRDSNLTKIGLDAFQPSNLKYFFIPSKCVIQDSSCFSFCPIVSISIDERNTLYKTDGTSIYTGQDNSTLFYVSSYLTGTYRMSSFVKTIANSAIRGGNFNEIIFNNAVTNVIDWCLANNPISSFTFPPQVTYVTTWMFQGCTSLESVTLTESITIINACAFYGCTSLISILLPSNLTLIGEKAFCNCIKLTSIALPEKLNNLGNGVFNGIPQISVTSQNPNFNVDGYIMYKDNNQTLFAYIGSDATYNVTVLKGCTSIGVGTFLNKKLNEVTFESQNTDINFTIGTSAFESSSIKSITFPPSLYQINENAFYRCYSLEKVVFQGTKLTAIPKNCFTSCVKLNKIVLPESIKRIDMCAFQYCSMIGDVGLSNLVSLEGIYSYAFDGSCLSVANLPDSCNNVEIQAFSNSKITSLTISCNVSKQLCQLCTSLTTLNLMYGVSEIGMYAFDQCSSLEGFTIPNTLETISEFAFQSCSELSSVSLSANCRLSRVDGGCFYGCYKLKVIDLSPMDENYRFENGALTDYAQTTLIVFLPYSGIKNFIVPSAMVSIGSCAFMGSPSLIRVFFNGNNIKKIDYRAFKDCRNLNFVFFSSSSIQEIGNEAFSGCIMLQKCGSFSAPTAAQNVLMSQAQISKKSFSDECEFAVSCKCKTMIKFSYTFLQPFIHM